MMWMELMFNYRMKQVIFNFVPAVDMLAHFRFTVQFLRVQTLSVS